MGFRYELMDKVHKAKLREESKRASDLFKEYRRCSNPDCSHKESILPLDFFPTNPYNPIERLTVCNDCHSKSAKERFDHQVREIKDNDKSYSANNVIRLANVRYDKRKEADPTIKKCVETLIVMRKAKKIMKEE